MKRQSGSKQNGGMRVVAAGVHHAAVFGAIGNLVFLGNRQGVNIGTQGNDRSLRIGCGRNAGNDASFAGTEPIRYFGGSELFG